MKQLSKGKTLRRQAVFVVSDGKVEGCSLASQFVLGRRECLHPGIIVGEKQHQRGLKVKEYEQGFLKGRQNPVNTLCPQQALQMTA